MYMQYIFLWGMDTMYDGTATRHFVDCDSLRLISIICEWMSLLGSVDINLIDWLCFIPFDVHDESTTTNMERSDGMIIIHIHVYSERPEEHRGGH